MGSQTKRVWSPFGSSYGSPEGPSLELTPPATPVKRQYPWDYSSFEITAKLEELSVNKEGSKHKLSNQNQSLPTKPNSDPIRLENKTSGFRQNQALTLDQIRAIQVRFSINMLLIFGLYFYIYGRYKFNHIWSFSVVLLLRSSIS